LKPHRRETKAQGILEGENGIRGSDEKGQEGAPGEGKLFRKRTTVTEKRSGREEVDLHTGTMVGGQGLKQE